MNEGSSNEHESPITRNDELFRLDRVTYAHPGGCRGVVEIDVEIRLGERLAILGANASGKSTFLHLLDGLCFASSGSVHAFGRVLTEDLLDGTPFARRFRRKVGLLFQNSDAQLFCGSVEEELMFAPLQLHLPADEARRRARDIAEMARLTDLLPRNPQALSEGEKRRVALGSVLTANPDVLLLDEPTSGLDPRTQLWLIGLLEGLAKSGKTLIAATHDLGIVSEIADRVLVLSEDHRLARDGGIGEVLGDTDLLLDVNLMRADARRAAPLQN